MLQKSFHLFIFTSYIYTSSTTTHQNISRYRYISYDLYRVLMPINMLHPYIYDVLLI